jgi:hypothetical protein
MRPVETIPGMGGWKIKENYGGGEFNYIYIVKKKKTFVNITMYPQYNNNIMIEKNKKNGNFKEWQFYSMNYHTLLFRITALREKNRRNEPFQAVIHIYMKMS